MNILTLRPSLYVDELDFGVIERQLLGIGKGSRASRKDRRLPEIRHAAPLGVG